MGREISYGFIPEARLEFLVDPTLGDSEVSGCACFREEFHELGLCCPRQLLGAIFIVFVDVYLERKEGILGREAGV